MSRSLQQASLQSNHLETQSLSKQLQVIKTDIKNQICELKLNRRHRLRSKLLKADPSRKKFWSFLKNQMKAAGAITGCYNTSGKLVFDQDEIEDAILAHFEGIFKGQRSPVDSPNDQHDQLALSILDLQNILGQNNPDIPPDKFEKQVCPPLSFTELELLLSKLPNGKASGYDQIPSEFLKHSSFLFKQYILVFLNKIIEEGSVPQALNLGKCMLIHKVSLF